MKYRYNSDLECFEREDRLGKKLWINSTEAQRIMTLYELGNSVPEIRNKITFNSRRVAESTITNFINNVNEGNIIVTNDYPVPIHEDLTIEERIQNLEDNIKAYEERFSRIEDKLDSYEEEDIKVDEVIEPEKRTWRERLGL